MSKDDDKQAIERAWRTIDHEARLIADPALVNADIIIRPGIVQRWPAKRLNAPAKISSEEGTPHSDTCDN